MPALPNTCIRTAPYLFFSKVTAFKSKIKLKTVEILEYIKTNLTFEGTVLVSLSSNN